MDAKTSDYNDTNSIPSSENTDISSEEEGGILDRSSSSSSLSDNDISKKSEEEKDEYLGHVETVKNQHFDEAINLSVSSTDLSSPDKDSSLSENQLMRNNKFNEDNMEDSPSINRSSSDELDSGADVFRTTTMGDNNDDDTPTNEKPSTTKKKNNEQTLLNDRYDVAFDVHDNDDDDISSSSIDTQPSEKSFKRRNNNEAPPPDQSSSYSSTFFQNQSQFSSQQQQQQPSSSFDEDDVTSSSSTDANSTQNSSYSTENESSPYHQQTATTTTPAPPPNAYNPNDYTDLTLPPEITELFQYITRYQPPPITIDNLPTELKCFIPPYIPAVGEMDPFLKMPRPDGHPDNLGTMVLDEVIPERQSDAAVLELKLSALMGQKDRRRRKKGGGDVVRSIENAAMNKGEIETWIKSVEEVHRTSALSSTNERGLVGELMTVELLERLMEPWSEGFEKAIREGGVKLPSVDLDLSLEEYAKVLCAILDIPVVDGKIVESVHMMFNLFMEFQDNQHFSSGKDIASMSAQNN